MRVAVCTQVAGELFARRLGAIPGVEPFLAEPAQLPAQALEADALVIRAPVYTPALAAALAQPGARCRWIQLLTAGFEQLPQHGVPRGVEVCGAGSVWSPIVAETGIALVLALQRRLRKVLDAQRRGHWDSTVRQDMEMLFDSRMVIVGMGSIGGELALRAKAFGMSVLGVSRRGRPHPAADRTVSADDLHTALAEGDVVALAVPISSRTERLIDSKALAVCKQGAVLLNLGRGAVVDTDALVDALRTGRLAGAALDVTEPEPLPDGHPLWSMGNVIIAPHIGGGAPDRYSRRLVDHVVRNVEARLRGDGLADLIDREDLRAF